MTVSIVHKAIWSCWLWMFMRCLLRHWLQQLWGVENKSCPSYSSQAIFHINFPLLVLTCTLQTAIIDGCIETSFQFKIVGYILENMQGPLEHLTPQYTIPGSYGSSSPGRTSPSWGCPPGWPPPPPPPRSPPSPPPCSPAPPSPPSAVVTPCTAEAKVQNRFCASNATVIVRLGGWQWSAEPATQTETAPANTWVPGYLGTSRYLTIFLMPCKCRKLGQSSMRVSGQLVGVRQTGGEIGSRSYYKSYYK